MRVSHLALDDFRSWKHGVVELPEGPTVLVGANGQGKTNLVEALAYLSTFSSHRVGAEGALVRIPIDEDEAAPGGAVIRARVVAFGREQVIELEIVRGKANRARINRAQVKPREILGIVRTVVFAPEDLSLVRGDPSVRRSFLDDLATQLSPIHASVRSDFDRVARQRAALMKAAQASEAIEATLNGDDISTAFNPQFLIDGLQVLDTDYVRFGFTHPTKPAVITGQKKADEGEVTQFRYLLMPIRFGI